MTAKQIISTDEMLCRTLRAYLEAQAKIYQENMPQQDAVPVQETQARYEVAALALTTLGRFVTKIGPKDILPDVWQGPITVLHDLICETGDGFLRKQGIDPADLA